VMRERDLELGEGRRLHVYDTAGEDAGGLAVFWQHGTPNLGEPPAPLLAAAAEHGMRWVSHDRPGYGSSTALPGRDVASVAADVGGMVDDDLSYVAPWGFDPARVRAPVLLLHGGQDRVAPRSHAEWLARHVPSAELWLRPDDGHVPVLHAGAEALGWLGGRIHRG
jgi:pimeloyl-ACP methyl ester carboxylesterase